MEMMEGAALPARPADEFGNDALVEEMWAAKAMDHAEVHFNLLTSVHPSCLRLTPYDDQIYYTFRQDFPQLKVDVLTDDILKSPEAKMLWRQFAEKFNKLEDYSFGTLMRANANQQFSPENSILVVRIQFLAIEIARNREGVNDEAYYTFRPPPRPLSEAYKQRFLNDDDKENPDNDSGKTDEGKDECNRVGLGEGEGEKEVLLLQEDYEINKADKADEKEHKKEKHITQKTKDEKTS